jgi:ribosome-binding protein aMBF1 (putative translation factor)
MNPLGSGALAGFYSVKGGMIMNSQLGNYVRIERQKAGLSRQQLAGMIGYKKS